MNGKTANRKFRRITATLLTCLTASLEPWRILAICLARPNLLTSRQRVLIEIPRTPLVLLRTGSIGHLQPRLRVIGFCVKKILVLQQPGYAVGPLWVDGVVAVCLICGILETGAVFLSEDVANVKTDVCAGDC